MNKLGIVAVLCALALPASTGFAGDADEWVPAQERGFVVAQQSDASKAQPSQQNKDKHWTQMQEHMKQMQTQMEKIRKTTNPNERQKLMQEHLQAMREHMNMMNDSGGCMMMHGMAHDEHSGTAKPERGMGCHMTKGADASQRQEMLEQRMDMMQMMMDQMMQQQEALQAKPK